MNENLIFTSKAQQLEKIENSIRIHTVAKLTTQIIKKPVDVLRDEKARFLYRGPKTFRIIKSRKRSSIFKSRQKF